MAREGLVEDSRWFQALVEHAQDWIVVLDAQAVISYASPSIERVLGYRPEERLGRPGLELLHPDDRPRVQAVLADLLRRPGGTAQVEARLRHKDGSWRVFDAVGRNLLDEPSVRGLVVHARDITEQVRQRARREALLRVARCFALETGPERLMRALLAEAVELTGGSFGLVARWDETRQVLSPVWNTLPMPGEPAELRLGQGAGGQAAERREPVILNDYQESAVAVSPALQAGLRAVVAAPLLQEARLLGVVTVATDVPGTQFEQDDAALLELLASLAAAALVGLERSRLEGALLAARTAQHALNNQLALTVGYADLLAADLRLPPDLREVAREALTGAQAAAATLQQLQRITRLEEIDQAGPGPVLDLARSAQRASQARPSA
jgi:PAS domain S-box-containing protein